MKTHLLGLIMLFIFRLGDLPGTAGPSASDKLSCLARSVVEASKLTTWQAITLLWFH